MINVTKLNGIEITVNAELIEMIEQTPDTIMTLTTGKKLIVSETKEEIINKVITYKQHIHTR
ncbi:MAG: flagellar FlbD family protein [Cellulosilyticaceae bacterium]